LAGCRGSSASSLLLRLLGLRWAVLRGQPAGPALVHENSRLRGMHAGRRGLSARRCLLVWRPLVDLPDA
jgi:hypothetical protein